MVRPTPLAPPAELAPLAPLAEPDPDAPREEPNLSYIPALDGVRAFAVLGVMAYHGDISWLPAGFLGVDAFFVLSGFLITSLLISEWQRRGTIFLGQFWARRARRLLPALLMLLVFVVLYANFVAPAGTYPGLRLDSLSTLFYVANWHFILIGSNYFDQTSLPSLLTHTWSLAVEEQFYLLWPLVVLALFARRRAGGAASLRGGPTPGGDPAWAASSRWARTLLSVLGALGVAGAALLWWRVSFNGSFLWEGGFLVAALSTAAVLACVVCAPQSLVARALSVSPLRYLGRISYGLYLWHFPLFQWIDRARTGLDGYALFGARCGATLAVATVSFYLVERPIRKGAFFGQWRAWVGAPVAVAAVSLTVVLATGSGTVAAVAPTPVPTGPTHSHKTVMVLGDSTALTFAIGLSLDANHYGYNVVDHGILGCGVAVIPRVKESGIDATVASACNPATPASQQWPALWAGWIDQHHPTLVAILAGRWEVSTVEWRGRWTDILEPAFAAYVRQQLQRAVDVASSRGARVVLFTAPCYDSAEQSNGAPSPEDQPDRVKAYNALVRQVVAANAQRATLVNLDAVVCPGGAFTTRLDGVTVRAPDGVHFPFFSPTSPQTADPDTETQVRQFGAWVGPRVWPSIVAADHPPAGRPSA
jgi:peptidoglycan/LPS O-acetylase OafA/YrhL